MSDKEFTSSAAEGQRDKLTELIAAKKGKGGASQREAKQFTNAWVAYVKTVGVNDETVGFLYDGFQFAAGEPIYRYVRESHSKTAYVTLLAARPTKANEQGIALRVAINLLALELPAPTSEDAAKVLAHAIPNLSKNKDGKSFGTLGRSIGKILIKPLTRKKIDERVSIPATDASLVLSVIRDPVEAYAKSGKARGVEVTAATQLLAWFEGQAAAAHGGDSNDLKGESRAASLGEHAGEQSVATQTVSTAPSADAPAAKEARREARRSIAERPVRITRIEPTAPLSPAALANSQTESEAEAKRAEAHKESGTTDKSDDAPAALDMASIVAFLKAYQKEHDTLVDRTERLTKERRDLSQRASHAEQELHRTQDEVSSLRERLSGLSERFAALQSEVSTLREANESLGSDLSAAEEMLSAIDQRDERQADESTRRLVSELKVEYRDFLDASDLTMDVELGENMRDQLRNVFGILKANGIGL